MILAPLKSFQPVELVTWPKFFLQLKDIGIASLNFFSILTKHTIKTFHNMSPNTHLSQYDNCEVMHKYMLTPEQNLWSFV